MKRIGSAVTETVLKVAISVAERLAAVTGLVALVLEAVMEEVETVLEVAKGIRLRRWRKHCCRR